MCVQYIYTCTYVDFVIDCVRTCDDSSCEDKGSGWGWGREGGHGLARFCVYYISVTHYKSLEIGFRCIKLQNPPLVHSLYTDIMRLVRYHTVYTLMLWLTPSHTGDNKPL